MSDLDPATFVCWKSHLCIDFVANLTAYVDFPNMAQQVSFTNASNAAAKNTLRRGVGFVAEQHLDHAVVVVRVPVAMRPQMFPTLLNVKHDNF